VRIPRDITGQDLIKVLGSFGYKVTRQTGSHMRLTRLASSEHHVTIPLHSPLRVGTLNQILTDIAEHLKITKDSLISSLNK